MIKNKNSELSRAGAYLNIIKGVHDKLTAKSYSPVKHD